MGSRRQPGEDVPEREQLFRYWVEIRDRRDALTRNLELTAAVRLHLPRKRESRRPDEQVLYLQDRAEQLVAKDLDDLAAQLRTRYPDGSYERRLQKERDRSAEQKRRDALNKLIRLIARAAMKRPPGELESM